MLHVAADEQRRVIGVVPFVVIFAQIGCRRVHDILAHAERRVGVRRIGIGFFAHRLRESKKRLAVVAVDFGEHRAFFEFPIGLAQTRVAHPVGFDMQREIEFVARHHEIEVRIVR